MKGPRFTLTILETDRRHVLPQTIRTDWSDHGTDRLYYLKVSKRLLPRRRCSCCTCYPPTCQRRNLEETRTTRLGSKLHVPLKKIHRSRIMTTCCMHLPRAGDEAWQQRRYGARRSPSMKHYVFAARLGF